MMNNKTEELIALYEEIIWGNIALMGLIDCLDPYYKGQWNLQLQRAEEIKKKINNNGNLEFHLNNILNQALINKRIKQPNSNTIAEFVTEYIEKI